MYQMMHQFETLLLICMMTLIDSFKFLRPFSSSDARGGGGFEIEMFKNAQCCFHGRLKRRLVE